MNKTIMLQLALLIVVIYGAHNIIVTETSGCGLLSMLNGLKENSGLRPRPYEAAAAASASVIRERSKHVHKHPTIMVEAYLKPHNGGRVFKCFTASECGWKESKLETR